ncbi:MAG: YheC/YheD family protein [Bacteroidia bacterium]|nr:YheC/YheD family protein [Bacteroidia bacterium]
MDSSASQFGVIAFPNAGAGNFSAGKGLIFGKQTYYFEDMVRSWPEIPFEPFFYFPQNLSLSQPQPGLETGYVFRDGIWQEIQQQTPKLNYFRAFSTDLPGKYLAKEVLLAFEKSSKFFLLNPAALMHLLNHKVDFHAFLEKHNLPTLSTFTVEESLLNGLIPGQKYYLKPIFGSMGADIYKIWLEGNSVLARASGGYQYHFADQTAFQKFLQERINSAEFLVQYDAQTVPFEGRPLDLRVLVQNYRGRYQVTGAGIRLGKKGGATANLSTGGTALPMTDLEDYFQKHQGQRAEALQEMVCEICLKASHLLATEYGEFLEIGFDILFTPNGPVILEGNAKPSRWVFNVIGDYLKNAGRNAQPWYEIRQDSVRIPLEFAAWRLGLG